MALTEPFGECHVCRRAGFKLRGVAGRRLGVTPSPTWPADGPAGRCRCRRSCTWTRTRSAVVGDFWRKVSGRAGTLSAGGLAGL